MQDQAARPQSAILVKNPLLRVSPFDDASASRQVLCEIPASGGKTYRFQVSEAAFNKLDAFDGSRSIAEAASQAYPNESDQAERDAFREFVFEHCLSSALLVDAETQHTATLSSKQNRSPMLLQLPLLKPAVVTFIARFFLPFYWRPALVLAIIAIVAGQIIVFRGVGSAGFDADSKIALIDLLWSFLILTVGLFVHEFGHAAAACRHGCTSTKIGVGLYICFIVFYADLSESWKLSRFQRIVIDCGGMYFQALFISLLVLINAYAPHAALVYAIVALNLSLLWNFNPFIKMDGYWLASDILGVTNLREEAGKTLRSVWHSCHDRTGGAGNHNMSRLNSRTRAWLVVYSVSSSAFLLWFSYMLIFSRVPMLFVDIRAQYLELTVTLWDSNSSSAAALVGGILWKSIVFGLMMYLAYRVASPAVRWIAKRTSRIGQ